MVGFVSLLGFVGLRIQRRGDSTLDLVEQDGRRPPESRLVVASNCRRTSASTHAGIRVGHPPPV